MNPPNQELDEIESRGVGPMDIFEDQHGRTRCPALPGAVWKLRAPGRAKDRVDGGG